MGYTFAGERDISLFELVKPVIYHTESHYYSGDFKQRSRLMFDDFLRGLISYSKSHGTKRVYFHNLSRFDGILLLKLLLEDSRQWLIKPVIREHNVYQVIVYDRCKPKVPVLDFRDSLKLLPGSLKSLAETMCPELGCKGWLPHNELNEFNISENKEEIIKYLEQDILLLAGVLRKAQEKYWDRFHIDITDCLTVSSMAMRIYRTHYYPSTYPIYRPQPNRAAFIRRGYYGGHTDVYKPYGKGLFYYDVNSLYPYAMTKPMPGGKPVWHGKLKGCDLEQLFGFVEAKVTCPDSIKVPLLPWKDPKTGTLLFPTGTFTGVYFTEELKLASKLGYQIELKRGYLFEKMESPFSEFVREIYGERKEAKMRGDQVMSSLHKLTMNSLYGRFGIRPECNITEICDKDRLDELMSIYQFGMVEPVNGTDYVISYTGELQKMNNGKDSEKVSISWMDLRNGSSSSAVQMSAAITAYARIHMYPYISIPGCYYTDTDSVVLDKPLPDSEVSSTELGKLKLEHEVYEGYFLAPKCYALVFNDSTHLIRNKGLAKDQVDLLWFMEQYKDLGRVIKRTVESSFRINWPKLQVYRTKMMINLGIDPSTKRDLVIDDNGIWIDTLPKRISNTEDLRSEIPGSPQPPASVGPDHVASGELPLGEAPRIEHSVPVPVPVRIHLEEELQTVKEELRTVKEELRSVKEEVQAERLRLEEELRVERSRLEEELQVERVERSRLSEYLQTERVMRSHLEKELQAERERLDDEEMLRTECERLEEELRIERLVCQNLNERLQGRGVDIGNEDFLFSDDQKWALSAAREKQRNLDYEQRAMEHQKELAKAALEETERFEREIEAMLTSEANTFKTWRQEAHSIIDGLDKLQQDSPDSSAGPSSSAESTENPYSKSGGIPDPDKEEPSNRKNGKKARSHWDSPSSRGPP